MRLSVAGRGYDAKVVRYLIPVDVKSELVHHRFPTVAGIFRAAKLAKFMQGGLKFKAPSPETGCNAAGKVVLFDQQCLFPGFRKSAGCRKSTVPGTDDYGIKFGH